MAKYDNRFLVQYFKDIYALHVLRDKIKKRIKDIKAEISQLEEGKYYNPCPKQPQEEKSDSGCLIGCAVPLTFIALFLLWGLSEIGGIKNEGFIMTSICLALVLILIFGLIWLVVASEKESEASNKAARIAYKQAVDEYNTLKKENELCRQEIPHLQDSIAYYEQELRKIDALIQNAYNINIIPNQYRDLYTVVYLYDYFEGSRETDLAMALNTFVLEQIKDRLDRIISQLSEMILNQYTMIQNQHMAAEEASRYHIDMKNRLNRIEATNEERNVYLDMIESNTATMRYFATVDYLTK